MADEIAQHYEAEQSALDHTWIIYRVRRGGWRDEVTRTLNEDTARNIVDELERTKRDA